MFYVVSSFVYCCMFCLWSVIPAGELLNIVMVEKIVMSTVKLLHAQGKAIIESSMLRQLF